MKGSDSATAAEINFPDVYGKGLRRGLSTWPSAVTEVTFTGDVKFNKDVNVKELNDKLGSRTSVNPEADFIPLGSSPNTAIRSFTKTVNFNEDVSISASPKLTKGAKLFSCKLDIEKTQCLCNNCEDNDCEYKGHECVIKTSATNVEDLIDSYVENTWSYIATNILKTSGDQSIKKKLKLHAGFKVYLCN